MSNKLYKEDQESELNNKINELNLKILKNNITEFMNNKKNRSFFTTKKVNVFFDIDDTCIFPNKICMLNVRNFDNEYYKQLEDILININKLSDITNLMPLLVLYNHILEGNMIEIKTNKANKLRPKICYNLNKFFNTYNTIIESIYTSINGTIKKKE